MRNQKIFLFGVTLIILFVFAWTNPLVPENDSPEILSPVGDETDDKPTISIIEHFCQPIDSARVLSTPADGANLISTVIYLKNKKGIMLGVPTIPLYKGYFYSLDLLRSGTVYEVQSIERTEACIGKKEPFVKEELIPRSTLREFFKPRITLPAPSLAEGAFLSLF